MNACCIEREVGDEGVGCRPAPEVELLGSGKIGRIGGIKTATLNRGHDGLDDAVVALVVLGDRAG
ncbi:MAG: hypothetical protein ACI8TP_001056 [Acidimicrobiales bacterium]